MNTSDSTEIQPQNVTIIIPTLNESETIKQVITGFKTQGYTNILVIDGGSTDGTVKIAKSCAVQVETQNPETTGKGAAVIESLEYIKTPYIVFIDGDLTYDPSEVPTLLQPLQNGYDEVIGNRFAQPEDAALSPLHKFGNYIIQSVFAACTFNKPFDILSGYRAYRTEALKSLPLSCHSFGIEIEISILAHFNDISTKVVPITYAPRPENSEAELNSFTDGFEIIKTALHTTYKCHI